MMITLVLAVALAPAGAVAGARLSRAIDRVPPVEEPTAPPRAESDDTASAAGLSTASAPVDVAAPAVARWPAQERFLQLVCALSWVAAALVSPRWSLVPLLCGATAVAWALTVIDVRLMRLPTPLVHLLGGCIAVGLVVDGASTGHWPIAQAAGSAALWFALYATMWLGARGRGVGLGDVRLAPCLGLFVGWFGWPESVVGLFGGFLLAAIVGGILIVARRATRTSHIAHGPNMIAAAFIAAAVGRPVWEAYNSLIAALVI